MVTCVSSKMDQGELTNQEKHIYPKRVDILFSNSITAIVENIVLATLLLYKFWDLPYSPFIIEWYVVFILLMIFRSALLYVFNDSCYAVINDKFKYVC